MRKCVNIYKSLFINICIESVAKQQAAMLVLMLNVNEKKKQKQLKQNYILYNGNTL